MNFIKVSSQHGKYLIYLAYCLMTDTCNLHDIFEVFFLHSVLK